MLTRPAGPNQVLTAEVQFAQSEDDSKLPDTLQMFIDKPAVGTIRLDKEKRLGAPSATQTAALLTALTKNGRVKWRARKASWSHLEYGCERGPAQDG